MAAGSAVTGLHVRFDEANAFARLVRRSVAPVAFPPVRSLHLPHRVRGSKQCGVVHRFGHRCASTCCAAARGSCALAPGRSCAGRRCVRFPIGAATTGGARATGRGPGVRPPRPQGDRRRHRRRLTAGAAEGAGWPRPAGSCRVGEQSGSGQVTGGGRVHVVVRLPATMTRNLLGPWHDEEATGQLRSSANCARRELAARYAHAMHGGSRDRGPDRAVVWPEPRDARSDRGVELVDVGRRIVREQAEGEHGASRRLGGGQRRRGQDAQALGQRTTDARIEANLPSARSRTSGPALPIASESRAGRASAGGSAAGRGDRALGGLWRRRGRTQRDARDGRLRGRSRPVGDAYMPSRRPRAVVSRRKVRQWPLWSA